MVSHANLVVFAFFKQPPFLSLKGLVPLLMVCSLDGIALAQSSPRLTFGCAIHHAQPLPAGVEKDDVPPIDGAQSSERCRAV